MRVQHASRVTMLANIIPSRLHGGVYWHLVLDSVHSLVTDGMRPANAGILVYNAGIVCQLRCAYYTVKRIEEQGEQERKVMP